MEVDRSVEETPASQRLTNEDFRKLLMTPRSTPAGGAHPAGSVREAMANAGSMPPPTENKSELRRKKKSYYAALKKQEDNKLAELAEKYRDRARERRDGTNEIGPADPTSNTSSAYRPNVESGFVKAQSDNLPKVDAFMVAEFCTNNANYSRAEIRGDKINRSACETYGNDAIGFVEVKRMGAICIVKAKITPEQKIQNRSYSCELKCNEKDQEIISIECKDCEAQNGRCKHGIAFMMWLHRRSEEPSPTEKICYWSKPKLSKVETSLKFIKAKDFDHGLLQTGSNSGDQGSFLMGLTEVLKEVPGYQNIQMMRYFVEDNNMELSLHCLYNKFRVDTQNGVNHFLTYCSNKMTPEKCASVEKITSEESDFELLFDMRYCRITASEAYRAAHCKTDDEALVEQLFGDNNIKDTLAMKRGKILEEVMETICKASNLCIKKSGFFLKSEWPVLGASADGVTEKYVINIKYPTSEKEAQSYVKDGVLIKKIKTQIQLQMYFAGKIKGLFCVANPKFENNKIVSIYEVEYDEEYCLSIMRKCTEFWKNTIFSKLRKTYQ